MATTKKETRYSTLSPVEELDLENDSDSTLASSGFLGKGASQNRRRPSKSSNAQRVLVWLRWGSIVILQGIIVLLLLWRRSEDEAWSQVDTETGGDINGLYVPREFSGDIYSWMRANILFNRITYLHSPHSRNGPIRPQHDY